MSFRQLLFLPPLSWIFSGAADAMVAARAAYGRSPLDAGTDREAEFRAWLKSLNAGTAIELGTRRTEGKPPTVRRDWVPPGFKYIGCDFQPGLDVDVVADVEQLSQTFAPGSVDAVIACSVFEHIRRPWLAAEEIAKVLRPGGRAFIQTHNCFPIHAHPSDYWRFTREALETLFSEQLGFINRTSWYAFPAVILSSQDVKTTALPAYLSVYIAAERA